MLFGVRIGFSVLRRGRYMKVKARKMVSAKPHAKLTTGEVIRMLRDLKGWTQTELAKRSGISATNLSCWKMTGWK